MDTASAHDDEPVSPRPYTSGRVRAMLWEWGALERGELGYQSHHDEGLGTPILATKRGSKPPLRVELLDLANAITALGHSFERAVITRWYARGVNSLVPLGLADPFTRTDPLDESPNYIADVRGMDAPDAGERVVADMAYRWGGRVVSAYDVIAARNRALDRLARQLRHGVYLPALRLERTNYAEVWARQTPTNQLILQRWLDGHTPAELARMFGRNESSMRFIIRRFRAALVVVDIALATAV